MTGAATRDVAESTGLNANDVNGSVRSDSLTWHSRSRGDPRTVTIGVNEELG